MSMLTIKDVSVKTGISQQALNKNPAVRSFCVGKRVGMGRPADLYHPDVVTLYPVNTNTNEIEKLTRKSRSDKGSFRGGRKKEVVEYLVSLAFTEFMSDAIEDIRSACRRAIATMYRMVENGETFKTKEDVEFTATIQDVDVCAKSEWLYFNWINRSDAHFRGVAHIDGWSLAHRAEWRKWDAATKSGSNRYTFWKIAENDLGAEFGRGRGRFIMMDDRQADVWTRQADGTHQLAYAVYAWDILTGELLWVEQAANSSNAVSANDYIRCILGVMYRCGLDCPVFHIENSKAAKAIAVTGAINTLYSEADMEFFRRDDIRKLYRGQEMIVRNVSHIPKDFGKAIGERLFGHVKRWDSLMYPQSFHGSGIKEAVQLSRAVKPTFTKNTPSVAEYFNGLLGDGYNEYLDQNRSSLKEWARVHNSIPTRRAMIEYYTPAEITMPNPEQTALLLYYAVTVKTTVRMSEWGQLDCVINNRHYRLRSKELYSPELNNRKMTVIPVPGRADECAVFDANGSKVRFVCIAKDFTGTTAAQAAQIRVEGRTLREDALNGIREYTRKTLLADPVELANSRRSPMPELPSPEEGRQQEVYFAEVIDEKEDEKLISNFYSTL